MARKKKNSHAWEIAKAKWQQAIADRTAKRLSDDKWEKAKKDFEAAARVAGKNPGELLIFGNPFSGWSYFTKGEKNFLSQRLHAPAPKNMADVEAYKEVLRKIDETNKKYKSGQLSRDSTVDQQHMAIRSIGGKANPGQLLIFGNPTPSMKRKYGYRPVFTLPDGQKDRLDIYHTKEKAKAAIDSRRLYSALHRESKVHLERAPYENPAPATEPTKLEKQRAARERAERIREARINTRKKKNAGLVDSIRPGDRVTILTPHGSKLTGRAVMRSSSGGWVLNLGGRHGTPGLADDRNIVRVSKRKGNPPVKMTVFFDPGIKKFTAALYDPKFGNLYASGFTKKQAAHALRDRVREYRRSGSLPAGGGYGNPTDELIGEHKGVEMYFAGTSYNAPSLKLWGYSTDLALTRAIDKKIKAAGSLDEAKKIATFGKRRNPSESKQAVRLFQGFHGHDPKEIVEKHVSAAVRLDYTALGDLVYLKVITPIGGKASFYFEDDGVKLAASPDGKQLYCIGGNQNILPCLDEDSKQKDFIDLGDAVEVAYLARKVHGQFRPIEYFHKFGEIDGTLPRLAFDKLRKQIFFFGGNYWIDVNMPAPGTPLGKISPGIEN